MNVELPDSSLIPSQIEQLIRDHGSLELDGHKLVDVRTKIIGKSEGYTSILLRANLKWSHGTDILPESIVIKIIDGAKLAVAFAASGGSTLTKNADDLLATIRRGHDAECSVYGFRGLADMVPMAKCYGARKCTSADADSGLLLLEDMSSRGSSMPMKSLGLGMNECQLDQLLNALAGTHAWSINTDVDWKAAARPSAEAGSRIFEIMRRSYDRSAMIAPEAFARVDRAKFDQLITRERFQELHSAGFRDKYGLPLVLVHGDIHPMNMIFAVPKASNEGTPSGVISGDLLALIDWQTIRQGSPLEDLFKVVSTCVSSQKRRTEKNTILSRYVELFNRKLVYPSQEIDGRRLQQAFDEYYSFMGVLYICSISLVQSLLAKMQGTDEEVAEAKKRMIASCMSMYEDAVEILRW